MKMTPTFIHYHPSHTKVKPFAGQRQYLHFSATLRPWVLVWSQGLNQGPPALQWSAVSTKLALHYCQTLTEKPKHLKYFRKVCVMNNNSRDQKRQTSHQAQTNSRLWFKLNFLTTISGVCCFSLSTPFPAPNPLPLLACESISSHRLPFSSLFGVSMGISRAYQSNPIAVVYDQGWVVQSRVKITQG